MLTGPRRLIRTAINQLGYRVDRLRFSDADFDPSRCLIATVAVDGVTYKWLVENPSDVIQSHHASGELYEIDALRMLRREVGKMRVFVDIGANVGNHTMFAALDMNAEHVIAFEPARKQHDILAVNIALNEVGRRVTVHKCALGDREGAGWLAKPWDLNLGSTKLHDAQSGEYVRIAKADDLLGGQDISCIKIDVEGHEMKVLEGLQRTIAETRPFIFVEVDDKNMPAFEDFTRSRSYRKIYEFRPDESSSTNILIQPA